MPKSQKTIVLYTNLRDARELEILARQGERLKRHGEVQLNVSSVAEPADVPPGGSPWHEYAAGLPALRKFVPHKKMQPFIDMQHVRRNRKLLADSLKVMRKHKMGAAFWFHIPFFIPEA